MAHAGRLQSRLRRLETAAQDGGLLGAKAAWQDRADSEPRTEAEWVEKTGEFLWLGFRLDKTYPRPHGGDPNVGLPTYIREFRQAAEAVWAEGPRRQYPADRLREAAAAAWAVMGPDILRDRRDRGRWVWDEPPVPMPPEDELRRMSHEELWRLHRQAVRRKGHWEKVTA